MADYLTRLVERTLGLAPTVRPDIPPVFAPQEVEPAPHDAPRVQPRPETGRAGVAARGFGPEPYTRSPERETAAREADHGPDPVPRFETPDGGEGEPATSDEPPVSENTDEDRRFDLRSTEPGADEDRPSGDPGQPARSSDSAPPDAPANHWSPGAENLGVADNEERRGAPISASSDEPSERLSGRYEPRSASDGPRDAPSRSSSRAGLRPGAGIRAASDPKAGQEEPDAGRRMIPTSRDEIASQSRRASDPADAVEGRASLAEGVAPARRRGPDREMARVPDLLVPRSGGEPDLASGREDPVRTPDPAADPRARRSPKVAAPGLEERHSGSPRRAVTEVPLVTATNPRRATIREREVGKEDSSPTVRVTIGRVEVRAVVPEPAQPPQLPPQEPPPPATRGPALSLDDYLERHAGGQR